MENLKGYKFPDSKDPARSEGLKEISASLYSKTDYSLVGGNIPTLFYLCWILRGMEQFMMDILINKEFANYLMDKIVDWDIALLDGILWLNLLYHGRYD